jgi:hypothetical protein
MEPTPTPTIFPGDTATKKKRASKALPDGLSELNKRNFRRSMEFRLETDFYEQSEVMVVENPQQALHTPLGLMET